MKMTLEQINDKYGQTREFIEEDYKPDTFKLTMLIEQAECFGEFVLEAGRKMGLSRDECRDYWNEYWFKYV